MHNGLFTIRLLRDEVTPAFQLLGNALASAQQQMLAAMGREFLDITLENFTNGANRPFHWAALSKKYAQKVGRSYATLNVSGLLIGSFQQHTSAHETTISNPVVYAGVHQYGYRHTPPRPYAPVLGDALTEYAENRIRERGLGLLDRLAGAALSRS